MALGAPGMALGGPGIAVRQGLALPCGGLARRVADRALPRSTAAMAVRYGLAPRDPARMSLLASDPTA